MTKPIAIIAALILALGLSTSVQAQEGQDTMHVVRVALREYSKARWSHRLILTPRTDIDRQLVARFGSKLDLADSVRATTPTRVSISSVVFQGDTVVSVFIDNKAEGRSCYFQQQIVLGRPVGTTKWAIVLSAPIEHACVR